MSFIHIFIFVFFFAMYFYWRLPKENSIRIWIDSHSIGIGNALMIFWILFFMAKSPRTAVYFGIPMLLIGGFLYYGKRRGMAQSEQDEVETKKKDPNNLGDPRDFDD